MNSSVEHKIEFATEIISGLTLFCFLMTGSESAIAMSENILGENITGMNRSELNSVIMNYLITGMLHQSLKSVNRHKQFYACADCKYQY